MSPGLDDVSFSSDLLMRNWLKASVNGMSLSFQIKGYEA